MRTNKVGYKNPPRETRFKPGNKEWQKREAKRQARKSRSFGDDVRAVLASSIRITHRGRSSSEIRLKGIIRKYISEALNGDLSAANDLLSFRNLASDFGDMRDMVIVFGPGDDGDEDSEDQPDE